MPCARCGATDTRIMDVFNTFGEIKRKRKCLSCGLIFNTLEVRITTALSKLIGTRTKKLKIQDELEDIDIYLDLEPEPKPERK